MKNETKRSTSNFSDNTLTNLLTINWSSMEPNKELEQAIASKFLTPIKFSMEIEKIVLKEEKTIKYLGEKNPKKIIIIPGKIVNIVI